jgi:phage/plasmid-associated DNA primase
MSSWFHAQNNIKINGTVVSAYYEVKSKRGVEQYKEWISNFLKKVPCYLVFFTEEKHFKFIQSCRERYTNRTHIICMEKEQWKMSKIPDTFWEYQWELDPEKEMHSPDLYKVWHEKKEFVRRAIELNPFKHSIFFWVDAGIIRDKQKLLDFPIVSRVPRDTFFVLAVHPFKEGDTSESVLHSDRIAGGILAGSKKVWLEWCDLYDKAFEKYKEKFIGKDQCILNVCVLENRSKATVIKADGYRWFTLLYYLS